MKTFLLIPVLALTGCAALKDDQVISKETVFGLNAETPGTSGMSVKLQIGLVRHLFAKNPVRTNAVYAAPFGQVVHADVKASEQIADEGFTMGFGAELPQLKTNGLPQAAAEEAALKMNPPANLRIIK